jgi:two-component system, OmpR family, catabolic regulation response regulator CreB
MPAHILIVEDEPSIADTIVYALKAEGHATHWVSLGQAAVEHVRNQYTDLVVLDVGLPDISGFEVCKQIRLRSQVPIIFLTARDAIVDRVVGLEIGADDYLAKPFSPRELTARVKAILKRTHGQQSIASDASLWFRIDEAKARITFCQITLDLTRYEYLLLKIMLRETERVFSRAQLMDLVWTSEASMERTVDAHVKSLRAKLRIINADIDPIQTHRGLGYSIQNKPI